MIGQSIFIHKSFAGLWRFHWETTALTGWDWDKWVKEARDRRECYIQLFLTNRDPQFVLVIKNPFPATLVFVFVLVHPILATIDSKSILHILRFRHSPYPGKSRPAHGMLKVSSIVPRPSVLNLPTTKLLAPWVQKWWSDYTYFLPEKTRWVRLPINFIKW